MEPGLMPAVMTGSQGEITPPAPRDPTSARESDSITRTGVESYQSPAGLDQVEFTVSVKDGVITAASSKVLATNDASKYNQGNFAKEVSAKVVGKSTKDFEIDAIGGASLTTAAFEKFV